VRGDLTGDATTAAPGEAARLVVVVPAYQAERHLASVVERTLEAARDLGLVRLVIVDDGSRDGTPALADALAAQHERVLVVHRARNGGYGAAMKDGLGAAGRLGAEVVACVHADGQYSPEALPRLLEERALRDLDLLQGSRIAGGGALAGGMPIYKYAANFCLNLLENRTLGLGLTDYHSGYLVYGPRVLTRVAFARLSDSFDFDLEVIASARAAGLAVGEAPIPTRYADEVSHLDPVNYGLRVLRVLVAYRRGRYAPRGANATGAAPSAPSPSL
jgi:glycosyltransferase involved in cell wall biosynthesis